MSSTPVQSVTSQVYISTATEQSDIVSRLVNYRNNFYYMDPSQPDSLIHYDVTRVCLSTKLQLYVLRVINLLTRMVLLKNVVEVRKSLFIMLLNNDIFNAFF